MKNSTPQKKRQPDESISPVKGSAKKVAAPQIDKGMPKMEDPREIVKVSKTCYSYILKPVIYTEIQDD